MLRQLRQLRKDERGMSFVFVGVGMTAFLSASMLAIDVGMLMVARSQAQNSADAGALAGAVALVFNDFNDRSANGPAVQSAVVAAQGNDVVGSPVSVSPADVTFPTLERIRVDVYRTAGRSNPLATLVAPLVGIQTVDINASATAEAAPANAARCVLPFTISDKWLEMQTPAWDPDALVRSIRPVAALALAVVAATGLRLAAHHVPATGGNGQGFNSFLPLPFTQSLYGASADITPGTVFGGVAFAPDGDVWVAECLFSNTRLHRFDRHDTQFTTSPVHATVSLHGEIVVDYCALVPGACDAPAPPQSGGCGLVNGALPDGSSDGFLYSNSTAGVFRLNADTGLPVAWDLPGGPVNGPLGPGGNGLGIAVDPVTGHLVYVASDCHPGLTPFSPTCTFVDLDPETGLATTFARVTANDPAFLLPPEITFTDGIYFDPSGNFLFVANRSTNFLTVPPTESNNLTVMTRPRVQGLGGVLGEVLPTALPIVDDVQIAQHALMSSEPDGVAFHAADGFVVTLNEDDGTMTRFDFPAGDFTATPAQSVFAAGGFRGDLLQVGADGCAYATQGFFDADLTGPGTRYDDGTETTEGSVVRICGGFVPPVGTLDDSQSPGGSSTLTGLIYCDANHSCFFESGESPIGGVSITLTDTTTGAVVATTTSDASGQYVFVGLSAGSYAVSAEPLLANATPLTTADLGGVFYGTGPIPVTLAENETVTDASFGYGCDLPPGTAPPAVIRGVVYCDRNHSCFYDTGDNPLEGVALVLRDENGIAVATAETAADGSYEFAGLAPGTYSVVAPGSTPAGNLSTVDPDGSFLGYDVPITVSVGSGETVDDANFGYDCLDPGRVSGVVYCDENHDCYYTAGEQFIQGVTVTLTDENGVERTTTSDGNGFYEFDDLADGLYALSTEASLADGSHLATADLGGQWYDIGPIPVDIAAGDDVTGADFGYACVVPGGLSGRVYVDLDHSCLRGDSEPGIGGVVVMVTDVNGLVATVETAPDGTFTVPDLPAGNYTVTVLATHGDYELATQNPLLVTVIPGATETGVDFGYNGGAPFKTFTQGGWKRKEWPGDGRGGDLLEQHFGSVYPAGVRVGGGRGAWFSGAETVKRFFPAGGRPRMLPEDYLDPRRTRGGKLAGETLALRLNVDYSSAGITRPGLAQLRVAPGKALAGYTVAEVLAIAEAVLGGDPGALPAGLTERRLAKGLARINGNFRGGRVSRGYLVSD